MKRTLCLLLTILLAVSAIPALAENVQDSLIVGIYCTRTSEIRPLNPLERDIVSVYGMTRTHISR